ncbi:helix-turn-helix transcriptional regulator [Pectobacterium actinidiae]|uniref:helix-turn-helix transcriptional regulator n=1 Tax=Pectobacterium actinidiae TaxID=1507808 RepID=UPI00381E98CA
MTADTPIMRVSERDKHDPARMLDSVLLGVPEDWRNTMQLDRPFEGVNICCMHGQPSSKWAFEAQGGPSLSMSILLEGQMEAAIKDGSEFRLQSGQALLMAVGQQVSGWDVFSTKREFRMVNINLTREALLGMTGLQIEDVLQCMRCSGSRSMPHVDVSMAAMPVFNALERVVGEISHCRYLDCRARNVFLCAKVTEAIATLMCRCGRERGSAATLRAVPSDRPRLVHARNLLESKYHEPWSVQTLAQAVGLNEKRLQAGFQALYGVTVHECLTRIRLDAALTMLMHGFSVTATAQAAGFASASHFSKVFSNNLGVSPKRWLLEYRATD